MRKNFFSAILLLFVTGASFAQTLLTQNFDTALNWTVSHPTGTSTNLGWTMETAGFSPATSPQAGAGMARFNSYSIEAGNSYALTSPAIAFTGGSYRVTFKMYRDDGYNTLADKISVYYNTTPGAAGATLLGTVNRAIGLAPVVTANGWYSYTFDIAGNPAANGYISFLATSEYGNNIFIDEVVVENQPTAIPTCATNLTSSPDNCGNFPSTISWGVVTGISGYYVTVGTTSGGTEIANAVSTVSTSYTFPSTFSTQYFWKVVPYNNVGSAVGCTEQSFTTSPNQCYCNSIPTSNDGSGVTNVQIGTTNFPVGDVMYEDFTSTPVNVSQGLFTNVQVAFATAYTYNTHIWIDFNNDYDFTDAGELVYSGESLADNPTTLNASFTLPANAPIGVHTMRIGTADSGQETPNPCFSDTYGVTLDFRVNVVAADCTPATVTTSIDAECENNQYFVAVNVTALGNGTPSITDGLTTYPVTAIGVVQVGPYPNGESATLTLLHGSSAACNLPLGTFSYICPPSNDNCANAVAITGTTTFQVVATGTNYGATNSGSEAVTACGGYEGGDVWYSVVVPASGNLTIETADANATAEPIDTVIAVYSGTCGALTEVSCDDDGAATDSYSMVTVTGQTPGSTLFLRVYEYGNDVVGEFGISAYDASLATVGFNAASFSAYPNPVKDILNLSYVQDISEVSVYNVLGQKVAAKQLDSTNGQIDMSGLTSGTYFVKINSGTQTSTLKVVKQ